MNLPLARTALLAGCLALRLGAADSPAASPTATTTPAATSALDEQRKQEEAIRLRLSEHALKKSTTAAPAVAATTTPDAATTTPTAAAAPAKDAGGQPAKPADDPTTLLPRVEVSQSRITETAIQLQEKDREIAREKKNAKPTGLDENLNDPTVAHTMSLFGGSSSEERARLAEERVRLLEAERDLIDQIALARTDAERDDLHKQLNELKTMRRELERAPRDERK